MINITGKLKLYLFDIRIAKIRLIYLHNRDLNVQFCYKVFNKKLNLSH